jgi:hypothetical protein
MPLPARARSTVGSASKSFTLPIRFARIRPTTTDGGARCADMVPQFTPSAASAGPAQTTAATRRTRAGSAAPAAIDEWAKAGIFRGLGGVLGSKLDPSDWGLSWWRNREEDEGGCGDWGAIDDSGS